MHLQVISREENSIALSARDFMNFSFVCPKLIFRNKANTTEHTKVCLVLQYNGDIFNIRDHSVAGCTNFGSNITGFAYGGCQLCGFHSFVYRMVVLPVLLHTTDTCSKEIAFLTFTRELEDLLAFSKVANKWTFLDLLVRLSEASHGQSNSLLLVNLEEELL